MHKFTNQYYEAIIQLRPATKELVDFVNDAIEKRRDVFVSKRVELKTGLDLYVSSWRFAIGLGKQFKRVFNGEVKVTRSLFTKSRITSKMVYRVTVLFRLNKNA